MIAVLAIVSRLWALGDRALHHDETLHAAYSWYLFSGRGYMHDPLLHGPLLYHLGAFFFFLFSDNDTTARLSAALFSIALTLSPILLRPVIGRPAALIASIYLLISPVALYVGRFFGTTFTRSSLRYWFWWRSFATPLIRARAGSILGRRRWR